MSKFGNNFGILNIICEIDEFVFKSLFHLRAKTGAIEVGQTQFEWKKYFVFFVDGQLLLPLFVLSLNMKLLAMSTSRFLVLPSPYREVILWVGVIY